MLCGWLGKAAVGCAQWNGVEWHVMECDAAGSAIWRSGARERGRSASPVVEVVPRRWWARFVVAAGVVVAAAVARFGALWRAALMSYYATLH